MQELLLADPIEDLMPLNDADRAWIRETIRTAHEKHGLGRLLGFIKDWGGTGAAVAILIFALAKWEGYVEFRTSTNIRLDRIEKGINTIENRLGAVEQTLVGIQHDLSRQSLIKQAALPLPEFKSTLPDLRTAIATAQQQKVKVDHKVVSDLQHKLNASVDAPDFWPTAAQFISYRSQTSVQDYQDLTRPDLPNCVDKPPVPMKMTMDAETEKGLVGEPIKPGGTHQFPALYENCRFTLDSPEETSMIPELGEGRSYVLKFRRCRIIYHGGPITLLTAHPHPTAITAYGPTRSDVFIIVGQTIIFDDCLFQFNITAPPVPDGQSLTRQLLSQSGSTLTVKFPVKSEPS
jgi:hypothetical protein